MTLDNQEPAAPATTAPVTPQPTALEPSDVRKLLGSDATGRATLKKVIDDIYTAAGWAGETPTATFNLEIPQTPPEGVAANSAPSATIRDLFEAMKRDEILDSLGEKTGQAVQNLAEFVPYL